MRKYEQLFAAAVERLGLKKLNVTPHCPRHGGASEDAFGKHLSIAEIQARGRWEDVRSVARYRKPGKLLRQQAKLSADLLSRAKRVRSKLSLSL